MDYPNQPSLTIEHSPWRFAQGLQTRNTRPSACGNLHAPQSQRADLGLESPSYGKPPRRFLVLDPRTPLFASSFASSRLRVRPTAPHPRSGDLQASQSQRAELGLESPSYGESTPPLPPHRPRTSSSTCITRREFVRSNGTRRTLRARETLDVSSS